MKILFVAQNLLPFVGGAERSIFTLLKTLAAKHEVHCLFTADEDSDKKAFNMFLHTRKLSAESAFSKLVGKNFFRVKIFFWNIVWKNILQNFLDKFRPDVIVTQLSLIPSTVAVANKNRIPVVVFLYDILPFEPLEFERGYRNLELRKKISFKLFRRSYKMFIEAIRSADKIVAASKFVANIVKKHTGVEAHVFYPFVNTEVKVSKNSKRYVTMVNPQLVKGAKTFLTIAKKRPQYKFFAAGRTDKEILNEMKHLSNLNYKSWAQPSELYGNSKVFLLPSIIREASPQTIIEANLNGIPCIVSKVGGIPELVGDSGMIVKDYENVESWLRSLDRLVENKNLYTKLSRKAKKQSKKFIMTPRVLKEVESLLLKTANDYL